MTGLKRKGLRHKIPHTFSRTSLLLKRPLYKHQGKDDAVTPPHQPSLQMWVPPNAGAIIEKGSDTSFLSEYKHLTCCFERRKLTCVFFG